MEKNLNTGGSSVSGLTALQSLTYLLNTPNVERIRNKITEASQT
ncbi:MAG: hypothetical protein ABFS56_16240 [Pseudomonadota bacterium]